MKKFIGKKIFYLFPEKRDYIFSWQRSHFIQELEQLGIEFKLYNPYLVSKGHFEEEVIKELKKNRSDYSLFMTSMFDFQLDESFVKQISDLGIPTLLICWDNLIIPYFHKKLCKAFDLVWLTSFETQDMFNQWGANTIFLPYASNPNVFKPVAGKEIQKLLFIGSSHGGRKEIVSKIASKNILVDVYGKWKKNHHDEKKNCFSLANSQESFQKAFRKFNNYWRFDIGRKCLLSSAVKKLGMDNFFYPTIPSNLNYNNLNIQGQVSFEDMVRFYSQYAISLSIIEYLDTYILKKPVYKLHLRTFEIPMSGGIQIVKRINEIENYFEPNNEILTYDSTEELYEKLNYYLHPDREKLRNIIKLNARKRSINEHTWENRFRVIFNELV